MILLNNDCFNALYLKALTIAISEPKHYQSSRNGPVINLGQAYLEIMPNDPRLIFLLHRKINPVFAIIEGAWVINGSNKLSPLASELPSFVNYSDDGHTLNGAYGNRLRNFFDFDQINTAVNVLKNDYSTRRVVLTMFAPSDLTVNSLDIPCNTTLYLKIRDNALDITVLNRSNDLYLGLPYNIFVFGLLQKYLSLKLNVDIGVQRHFSDSLHLYKKDIDQAEIIVRNNNIKAISAISNKFNWEYTDAILENIQKIIVNDYDTISNIRLKAFLNTFSRENRSNNKHFITFYFSNDFYDLLAYQCFPNICANTIHNKYGEKLRKLMMTNRIEQKIKQLSLSSGQDIAQNITELTKQLEGHFHSLKQIIDKRTGPFGFKNYDDEEFALHVLLLCLVWTTLDPYTANTSIGTMQKNEIETAASILNVPTSEIGPFGFDVTELFSVLSELLTS